MRKMECYIKKGEEEKYRKSKFRDALLKEGLTSMPIVKDLAGNVLERIIITPLYGSGVTFADPKEAVDFILNTPDEINNKPIYFNTFKIDILYKTGGTIKMDFGEKEEPVRLLRKLFELEDKI